MGNKELGIADPVYDALRIRSGQSIAPDLGSGIPPSGGAGLENKIYLWHTDGSAIDTFDPNATGLGLALAGAASGDTVWLPSITIALTAGITIPAGVQLTGFGLKSILSFSGFSGDAVTLSAGVIGHNFTVIFNGTGYATARGVVAPGVGCVLKFVESYASGATTNIGMELSGQNISALANTEACYAEAAGGTTAVGARIGDFCHANIYAQGKDATNSIGIRFACTSAANAGWLVDSWGYSPTAGSYGMEIEAGMFGNIVGGFARGLAAGLLIGAGATALIYGLQWSSLTNSGTITYLPGDRNMTGAGGLGWFVVTDYGATGDGTTDDTAAIQDTIDAAFAAGGGVVYFPRGVYKVAGALGGGGANSQLVIPSNAFTDDPVSIEFLGAFPPTDVPPLLGSVITPTRFSIIKGTLNSGAGGALLGGIGPMTSWGYFTYVQLKITNLMFEMPTNPVLSALNLLNISNVEIRDCVVVTGDAYDSQNVTEPTTATSYGIKLPARNNQAWVHIDGLFVGGFYNGLLVNEHTDIDRSSIYSCKYAIVSSLSGHAVYIGKLLVQWCANVIQFTGAQHIEIMLLNIEHYNPALYGAKWYNPATDIDDPSDYGIGSIIYHATLSVTGADDALVISGAANLHIKSIHDAGAGGVSSIAAGTGITATPDPIVATGTIAIADTAVTPGSYKTSNITVDQQGRLTAAADGALNDLSDVDTTGTSTGDVVYNNAGTWQDYPLGVGSKITVSGSKIRFGNVGGGNYLEIDTTTGNLRLVGDATTYDDFRVEASVIKPGATAPNWKAFGPSGNLQALMFEASHHDEAYFELQMPHTWKLGTNIYPHVHWTPVNTTAGNVVWELEYAWANVGDAYGAPGNMATDATAAGGVAWVHKLTDFKESGNNYISGAGKTLSSMLVCRVHRNSNAGSDTLNQDVALLEIDFHYQIDSLGSDEPLVKDASASLLLETGDILLLESGDRLLLE